MYLPTCLSDDRFVIDSTPPTHRQPYVSSSYQKLHSYLHTYISCIDSYAQTDPLTRKRGAAMRPEDGRLAGKTASQASIAGPCFHALAHALRLGLPGLRLSALCLPACLSG